jgi:hypothetical protein
MGTSPTKSACPVTSGSESTRSVIAMTVIDVAVITVTVSRSKTTAPVSTCSVMLTNSEFTSPVATVKSAVK